MYQPWNWVILEIEDEDGTKFTKVLAQIGVSLNDWRINSGIKEIEQDDEFFYFIGASGSTYKCAKDAEKLSRTTEHTLTNYLSDSVTVIKASDISKNHLLNC